MLLNKRMGWKELLTAAYLNFLGPGLYYRFLTDHVGEGDKETFAYSYLLWGRPYHLIGKKVEAVGIRSPEGWIGHGMMQRSPAGFPVFLHANIRKPNFLTLPDRLPLDNKGPKYKTHDAEMTVAAGYNVESFAHQVLRAVRCDKHVAAFTFSSRISKQPAMDTIFSGIKSLYRKCKLSRTTDENREYMTGVTVIDPLLAWPLC